LRFCAARARFKIAGYAPFGGNAPNKLGQHGVLTTLFIVQRINTGCYQRTKKRRMKIFNPNLQELKVMN
jgi:hypothetical protein